MGVLAGLGLVSIGLTIVLLVAPRPRGEPLGVAGEALAALPRLRPAWLLPAALAICVGLLVVAAAR